eukprot:3753386-Amphidinium_carterae.1
MFFLGARQKAKQNQLIGSNLNDSHRLKSYRAKLVLHSSGEYVIIRPQTSPTRSLVDANKKEK